MAYPDRIAVLDPATPDINLILRQVVLSEGAVPVSVYPEAQGALLGWDDAANPGNVRSAQARSGIFNPSLTEGPTSDPDAICVFGVSRFGWGRLYNVPGDLAPYADTIYGAGVLWTQGSTLFYYGGPSRELPPGGAPLGVWEYRVGKSTALASFDGGDFEFTPVFESIDVDWGVTGADIDLSPGLTFDAGIFEAPLSAADSPAIMNLVHWRLTLDPNNFNPYYLGLELRDDAGSLEINLKYLFDDPAMGDYPSATLQGISTSPDDPDDNWAFWLNDDPDIKFLITRFTATPLWESVGVLGTPSFDHYQGILASDGGSITEWNARYALGSGWLIQALVPPALEESQWYLVSPDWTTYQRVNLIAGEQEWCAVLARMNAMVPFLDTNGEMLWVTYGHETEAPFAPNNVIIWKNGEMAEGFHGCDVPIVPPVPTIVTGDVILRAWPLSLDGHDMYVIRLGLTETLIYDKYSKQWFPYTSLSNAVWAINTGFEWVGGVGVGPTTMVVGDDTTGNLYFLDPEQPYDEPQSDEDPTQQIYFDRIVQGQIAKRGTDAVPCFAALLTADMGQPAYDGAGVTLYTSDDAGETWDSQGLIAITADNFTPELIWDSLGQIMAPGRLFMLIDDGAVTRIDGLEINPND